MASAENSSEKKMDQQVVKSPAAGPNNVNSALKNKKMRCCSTRYQKGTIFCSSVLLIIAGLVLVFTWQTIYQHIIDTELTLKNDQTQQFKYWKETPIPMYFEIYLFNWTNAKDFEDGKPWTVKPQLEELGPYTFHEHHSKVNTRFNPNNTISFNNLKTWHFVPEKSRGSLDDLITTVNTIALTVGTFVKDKPLLARRAVSFLLEEKRIKLTVTHTAREFLFDGYNDTLLNILHKIDIKGVKLPFDKFGWFYTRNGSVSYDGNYTMNTGSDDIQKLGRITEWNFSPRVPEYNGYCGMVNGTTGELWYPVKNHKTVSIFVPDVCSSLKFEANGTYSYLGLNGNVYTQTDRLFDNGTKYPEMACFSPGEHLPAGVRNVSQCKFGAPAFMSMPHFYMADPSYREAIGGMHPNPDKHNFYLALEPDTGLPLKIDANLQVSLYLRKIPGISLFDKVTSTMMPVIWFRQTAELTAELANLTKTLLILKNVGDFTGYGIIGIGCLLLFIGSFITVRDGWNGTEDEEPLTQNHL